MDWEHRLICKAVREQDLRPALDARISGEFFVDERHRRVWEFTLDHWAEYGAVPTAKTIKANFPAYRLIVVDEPYALLINELREQRRRAIAVVMATQINTALSREMPDVDEMLEAIHEGTAQLHIETGTSRDVDITETWQARFEAYMALKELEGGMRGIPTGFPTIDRATLGLQKQQLVTLIALPKTGKSTVLLKMAMNIHLQGYLPLFVGFEMSNEEQEARRDALLAGIDHHKLLAGTLTSKQERRLQEALEKAAELPPFVLSADRAGATISGLRSKIEQFRPDVLFVDGAYLMEDERGETDERKVLTNLSRDMKKLAQGVNLPIVQTTQVLMSKYSRRRGLTGDAIGYTSAYWQDSDVILGVERLDPEDEYDTESKILLRVVESRNSPRAVAEMDIDLSAGLCEEIGEYDPPEDDDDD